MTLYVISFPFLLCITCNYFYCMTYYVIAYYCKQFHTIFYFYIVILCILLFALSCYCVPFHSIVINCNTVEIKTTSFHIMLCLIWFTFWKFLVFHSVSVMCHAIVYNSAKLRAISPMSQSKISTQPKQAKKRLREPTSDKLLDISGSTAKLDDSSQPSVYTLPLAFFLFAMHFVFIFFINSF